MPPVFPDPNAAAPPDPMLRGPVRPELLTDGLLHELFAETALRWPDRPAVQCGDTVLTYGDVRRAAAQFARHLRRLGIGRGDAVVLRLPRSSDMLVVMLGILEAGACYVPVDPDSPADRVAFVALDCRAKLVVTSSELVPADGPEPPCRRLELDREWPRIATGPDHPVPPAEAGLTPDDRAYIIYTSGSTGRPKGVTIPHRAIRHFVVADASVLGVTEKDVVAQSASLAFDLSLEEIWLAFAAGAKLLVVTREMLQTGGELCHLLAQAGVTVWSTVPTLLAMQEADLPGLRLLILGGETLPAGLARRWLRPGRRLINSYGPTETTVAATWCEVAPGGPVTIGRPLPNYSACVVDEQLQPVPPGGDGELCLGGPGVAPGYLNRPELTAEKFMANPFAGPGATDPVLYRTGDRVRVNPRGELEFLGRIDTQVKIRGHRVELAEIEAVLIGTGGLRHAVVTLAGGADGRPAVLAAYLLPTEDTVPDVTELKEACRLRLPAYMVPAVFQMVKVLPMLPSGKVDRKNLPPLTAQPADRGPVAAPTTPSERALHQGWTSLFAPAQVSIDDDFFLDLGGHSLRAAEMVSHLRRAAGFRHASMRDVYAHPTIRRLAAHLTATAPRAARQAEKFHPADPGRYALCTVAQGFSLLVIFGIYSLELLVPYLTYVWLVSDGRSRSAALAWAAVLFLAMIPALLALAVAIKWLVLGRTRPGIYPLWGQYYFRWWFVQRLLGLVPTDYLAGTPLLGLYLRLLGARIGRGVYLGDDAFDVPDLVEIGDGSSIGYASLLSCARVEKGWLKLGVIRIGAGCYVGNSAVIAAGAELHDRAFLDELSMLPAGQAIPAGEIWAGSPARRVGRTPPAPPVPPAAAGVGAGLVYAALIFIFPLFALLPIVPGLVLMTEISRDTTAYWLWFSPLLAAVFIVTVCLEIAALKWLVLGRVRAGVWPVHGRQYIRRWFVDKLMEMSLDVVNPLYATLYINPWYRLLGVQLGARAELSTAAAICHDLLTLEDESFVADAVLLGVPRVHDGLIELAPTRVGRRAFVGNSALVPAGSVIGANVLIGCLSVPPPDAADAARSGTSWFGTPAILLPRRQQTRAFDESTTFRPPARLVRQRLALEAVRVLLPLTLLIIINSLLVLFVLNFGENHDLWGVVWRFPFLYLALALVAGILVAALKWLVVDAYRPVEHPLWSPFVWRSELVTTAYENVAVPLLCEHLQGTPFLAWYLRLLGTKVGERVYFDTTDLTEFDTVTIGDDAALNGDCGLQTHLFEDRVMKISTVTIGPRCTVGAAAVTLYDSRMEADSTLENLSMLMKGETLPAGTVWQGSPAQRTDS